MSTVGIVARREIAVALRNKSIMFSLVLLLVLMLGGIGLLTYLSDREPAPQQIAADIEIPGYETVPVDSRTAAEEAVLSGEVVAALVGDELLVDGSASPALLSTVNAAIVPADIQAAIADYSVTEVDISASTPAEVDFLAATITLVGLIIIFMAIMYFAGNIGARVTEEKSSRVVEIVLAAVRPMDFLAGKIIGNALFGFVATLVLVGIGAVALNLSGLIDATDFPWSVIPILLVAFLLGMLFFGSLYAAAGALVQRTEDLQSTQWPIFLLVFVSIYILGFGFGALDAQWMQAAAWIPPVSIGVAPLQYAAGNMSGWELAASFAIMAVVTVIAIWLAARIYRTSILNNGRKMGWVEALRVTPA